MKFKFLLTTAFILLSSLSAQQNQLSDIFFLDLGIVIEPSKGSESYSRVVRKTSEEVSFKIKKAESGSVFMASSQELLTTLSRINERMQNLETSFQAEMSALRQDNNELKQTIASIQSVQQDNLMITESSKKNYIQKPDIVLKEKPSVNISIVKINPSVANEFDKSLYMSGVFAYQREDYNIALNHFTSLQIDSAPEKTIENILYWMADAYQQTGKYEEAFLLLDKITNSGNLRIDDALVQKGLLHRKMGEEDLALAAFEDVVSNYPDSEYMRLAKMELKKVK